MKYYNRFDVERKQVADPDAWMAAAFWLTAWLGIAAIAFLETFTDVLG